MEVLERKQRTREQTRQGIVFTAKDIARREGWQAVSIRKIADAIDYSAPIVYEYFDSKDILLHEIRAEGFRFLREEYNRIMKLYRDPEKRLYEISLIQWKFAFEQPETYQVMYNLNGAFCQVSICGTLDMEEMANLVRETIFSFIPKSKESIQKLYFEWWSISHGIITMSMILKDQQPIEQSEIIYRDTLRRFIRNLR
ncbi:TetR/AcrR family transcriptional regulator [Arsenicibacter rosenii]|uniref:TetR family transcriptional regulator n=1 Tax=Arsenicibacter rosenii TaxID=1750698 RepID=A0A1S2VRC8_9BACT|nr:TetR/AcrR family transcriptional regulator [Arsenicibacter rosenii]OIN60950.1 TetR family transcriptional regulator [Arsenicibacter rosenii]